jgi:hypothetical protein
MLKVYYCDDFDMFAAESADQAADLYEEMTGDRPDESYPRELTDAELDVRYPAFDEDERPIEGQTISVREMLAENGDEPGWLAGSDW